MTLSQTRWHVIAESNFAWEREALDWLRSHLPDRDPWHARYTAPFNFAGLPTLSVPCGLSDDGLPLSIQFAGHALREDLLVRVGHAYEQVTDWHRQHPPGC